ncbi:MAG: DUF4388 domain-containing protein [Myxococcaceae bacterium]|nr:DUF4388 domain-containing protein [Myxococcaceae bacterium]
MAFHGDLSSYPLPELLQWLDQARKTGALQLSWEGGDRKLFLLSGQIVATASPSLWERLSRALEQGKVAVGAQVMSALAESQHGHEPPRLPPYTVQHVQALAVDELLGALADLTSAQGGRFHWTEDPDRSGDEWVAVELALREALFESLRFVDEWAEIERQLPLDGTVVRPAVKPTTATRTVDRLVLEVAAASPGITLGRLRLALGLQRSLVVRAVHGLWRDKKVTIDGAGELEADPVADMLEKGAILVRERQFEAAGLIFSALMQSDPSDRRVREFARMVEREHVASLYRDLPPRSVLAATDDAEAATSLRSEERHLAALVNGRWDVSALVLASDRRELDTLRCLHKLLRLGVVRPVSPPETAG